jgi:hypothetical protein
MANNTLMQVDQSGWIGNPGNLDKNLGGALTTIGNVSGKVGVYGNALHSVGNIGNLTNDLYNNPTNLDALAKFASATSAIGSGLSMAIGDTHGYLNQLVNNPQLLHKLENDLQLYSGILSKGVRKYNAVNDIYKIKTDKNINLFSFDVAQRLHNAYFELQPANFNIANYMNPPINQSMVSADKLCTGLTRMIEDSLVQGIDLYNVITNSTTDLLTNRKTDPNQLLNVLQSLEQQYAQNAPNVSNILAQVAQNIMGNGSPQYAM